MKDGVQQPVTVKLSLAGVQGGHAKHSHDVGFTLVDFAIGHLAAGVVMESALCRNMQRLRINLD